MKYEDIKNYATRCDSHPDHQTGIITHQMIMDRLHDEIEELRGLIEAKRKPLTDGQIGRLCGKFDARHSVAIGIAREIERAHGIGEKG